MAMTMSASHQETPKIRKPQSGKLTIKSPVAHICTAGTKNQGEKAQARDANRNVLRVAQTGLYHASSKPVNELSVTRLNDRMRNVVQSLATRLMAADDRIQPRPSDFLKNARTAASSRSHKSGWRKSAWPSGT